MTEPTPNEPVSWLRLERYHLGELPPEEAREVERAIAADPATRECLEQIRRPVRLNPRPEVPSAPARVSRLRAALRSPWPIATLAAAAALALFVVARPAGQDATFPIPPRVHVKGGDVAVELVRERDGVVDLHPTTFRKGDRFKVMLTCPPSMDGHFDVLVAQGHDVFFPLPAVSGVACGNSVPLDGAFSLDGNEAASVCVTWGGAGREGATLAGVRGAGVCVEVKAE